MKKTKQDQWQNYLKTAITCQKTLNEILNLPPKEVISNFKLKVPLPFINKIKKNQPNDPLLLQVLIQGQENEDIQGFSLDPLLEKKVNPVNGIIHKYHARALVILSGGCAINCRYCFRRHFDYQKNTTNLEPTSLAFQYLANNKDIKEVILSGGDPLLHNDDKLQKIITNLNTIPHLKRLRIHTRLPIVIPQRITSNLTKVLSESNTPLTIVIHCNHPQELDSLTKKAFLKLKKANITLLNQSVLLKNINDNAKVLHDLSEKLFEQGVLPYYLHTLDLIAGGAHFMVEQEKIAAIQQELLIKLPGYLAPKIVTDGHKLKFKLPFYSKMLYTYNS